jgi:thymidylate synthase
MTNEQKFLYIIKEFYNKIQNNDIVQDKSGVKVVELIAPRIELNPMQPILNFNEIRTTPLKYCEKEIKWYESTDLNIKNWVDDIKIWKDVSDKDGYINSNYGWCIFHKDNYNQYENCLKELIEKPFSRKAIMYYTRPSMWEDWNKNGMSDTICTLNTMHMIRNNKLYYIINQRSLDFYISGLGSDLYWHCWVYNKLYIDLLFHYSNLEIGSLIWLPLSCHVYESHWNKIKEIIKSYGLA